MTTAEAGLKAYAEETLELLRPCSAGVVVSRKGEPLFEHFLTGPEPQDPNLPVTKDSLWPWWSVTKSVTMTLVLRLAARGLLGLDDSLGRHLPAFREEGPGPWDRREVRLRHLCSHTSGCAVPGRDEDGISMGNEPVELERVAVVTEPGTSFVYSALGMHLLERYIEAATGKDFGLLLREEVLHPADLDGLRYVYPEDLEADPGLGARLLPCRDGSVSLSQRQQRAGLGLYGRAADLAAFGGLWLDEPGRGPALDPGLRREAWRLHAVRPSDGGAYGLLWWVFPELGGYVASGASFSVCAVLPAGGVVVGLARNHVGPLRHPFDYLKDKQRLVELGRAFF